MTGVKQCHRLAGLGIKALGLDALETVAQPTAQPKVLFVVWPTFRLGDDVFDFERTQNQPLRTEAIATTIAGLGTHPCPDFRGNICSRSWLQWLSQSSSNSFPQRLSLAQQTFLVHSQQRSQLRVFRAGQRTGLLTVE